MKQPDLDEHILTLRHVMDQHTDGDSRDDIGDSIEAVLAVLRPCNGWAYWACPCDHCDFMRAAIHRAGLQIKSPPLGKGPSVDSEAGGDLADDEIEAD
jgi:hypothetical protein